MGDVGRPAGEGLAVIGAYIFYVLNGAIGIWPPAKTAATVPIPREHELTVPPGLPVLGKWMVTGQGTIAHWLGEVFRGKQLREPINVIIVDEAAGNAAEARRRLIAAASAAGYPIRFGHSDGYRAYIGDEFYQQLPRGDDDAFSNDIFFELANNHGRLFGRYKAGGAYVFTGAFSREAIRPFSDPAHGFVSFNRARDAFSQSLDKKTAFKIRGFVHLDNVIDRDAELTTGDHDGRAVELRADR